MLSGFWESRPSGVVKRRNYEHDKDKPGRHSNSSRPPRAQSASQSTPVHRRPETNQRWCYRDPIEIERADGVLQHHLITYLQGCTFAQRPGTIPKDMAHSSDDPFPDIEVGGVAIQNGDLIALKKKLLHYSRANKAISSHYQRLSFHFLTRGGRFFRWLHDFLGGLLPRYLDLIFPHWMYVCFH